MFNYLLFDIDNTLFSYDNSHNKAMEKVFSYIENTFSISLYIIQETFLCEKNKYKNICINSASSHSKYIQFKKLLEALNISLDNLDLIYNIYEQTFIDNLILYDNILNFLEYCNSNNIKLYILTNNICTFQINILKKLKLYKYFEKIYTSEEFNTEKPDTKLYNSILNDILCSKHDIAMIGDNYKHDIEAVTNIGMYAFYFTNTYEINIKYTKFESYSSLINLYKRYHTNIYEYIKLSYYIGERFDLVQAGGGNTSVKIDNILYIKSSGCKLTEVGINKNYIGINYKDILHELDLYKNNYKELINKSTDIINKHIVFLIKYKPSIETTLHCISPYKYTIHVHSIQFNKISGLKNCFDILSNIFTSFYYLEYTTPGIDIYYKMINTYNNENIIFMQNHGFVITHNDLNSIYNILENTILKLEEYLNIEMNQYKYVNIISKAMYKLFNELYVTTYIEDTIINSYLNNINLKPFLPDKVVYAGIDAVYISSNIEDDILKYKLKNNELPKIFIKDNQIYISSKSLNKCYDIEKVLKAHLMCVNEKNNLLSEREVSFLNNWDAEKYRKII